MIIVWQGIYRTSSYVGADYAENVISVTSFVEGVDRVWHARPKRVTWRALPKLTVWRARPKRKKWLR